MKYILLLALVVPAAIGQTGTASIAGAVVDAKTLQPIPSALVMAIRSGLPPHSRNTKSGGAGEFRIEGLAAGQYSLCVQTPDEGYLDPCQWNGSPTPVTLVAGQAATGVSVRLAGASVLTIQVQDAQKVLSQTTRDGRRPELTLGVWGPNGLYYPARRSGSTSVYRIGVPRDTALKLYVASRDLRLGDAAGAALSGNASQHPFLHATGDLRPKSFTFTVLGLRP